jgi:hypothetical protein
MSLEMHRFQVARILIKFGANQLSYFTPHIHSQIVISFPVPAKLIEVAHEDLVGPKENEKWVVSIRRFFQESERHAHKIQQITM